MDAVFDFVDDALGFLRNFPWLIATSLFLYLGSVVGLIAAFLFEGQWAPWLAAVLAALCLNRVEKLIFMLRVDGK